MQKLQVFELGIMMLDIGQTNAGNQQNGRSRACICKSDCHEYLRSSPNSC